MKYHWDRWLAQPRTVLTRGVDYACSQSSICQQARNAAAAAGIAVKIEDHGDRIVICHRRPRLSVLIRECTAPA